MNLIRLALVLLAGTAAALVPSTATASPVVSCGTIAEVPPGSRGGFESLPHLTLYNVTARGLRCGLARRAAVGIYAEEPACASRGERVCLVLISKRGNLWWNFRCHNLGR